MTLPTAKEFKEHAHQTVRVMSDWAREVFTLGQLPIKIRILDRNLNYYGQAGTRRDKQERFTHFEMSLSSYHFLRYPQVAVTEYASFNASKVIGGFESNDWRLGLDALIAHEMAHIIQFAVKMSAFDHKAVGQEHPMVTSWNGATPVFGRMGPYEGHHGMFFQHIYKRVREQFINARVPRSAYTEPKFNFLVPDDFEERLAAMPKSGLEGLRFMSNGRLLEVAGRNPNTRRKLYNYQVKEVATGRFLAIKMALIAVKCPEAKRIIDTTPELYAEFYSHCLAIQGKTAANAKSRQTKQRKAQSRRMAMAA